MTNPTISLSAFRASATKLLDDIHRTGGSLVLTQNGAATAVVQDIETYEAQKKALLMLKLMAQGEADIRAGKLTSQDDAFDALDAELDAME